MSEFDAIVAAHSPAVWRTAYRLLGDYDDALDCYQETFLSALRMNPSKEVRHWPALLKRIATRRAIDQLRHRYQNAELATRLHAVAQDRSPGERPDARGQAEELQQQVRVALSQLPPQQAEAFWLRHL